MELFSPTITAEKSAVEVGFGVLMMAGKNRKIMIEKMI